MKLKKRYFAFLLSCFITLTGCASGNPNTDTANDTPAPAATDSQDSDDNGESGDSDSNESPGGWEYIESKGQLVIGLDDTFAPMGFRDEAGNLVGFDIDLATAVCEYLGVEAVFQPIDWSAKEMELSTGKIDCIWNGMSITDERQEIMSLTAGYLNNRIIIMSVPGVEIGSKEDLINYNVATQAKSAALEVVQGDPIYAQLPELYEYNTYDEVIMDMDATRIDVMIVDEVLGMYKNSKRSESFVVSSVDFGDDFYAVGCRKEDPDVAAKIEEAIGALIDSGKAVEISEKWFGSDMVLRP